ncbi:MAG: hypothetical protein WBB25_08045, partial [Sulfitobacter sp.]
MSFMDFAQKVASQITSDASARSNSNPAGTSFLDLLVAHAESVEGADGTALGEVGTQALDARSDSAEFHDGDAFAFDAGKNSSIFDFMVSTSSISITDSVAGSAILSTTGSYGSQRSDGLFASHGLFFTTPASTSTDVTATTSMFVEEIERLSNLASGGVAETTSIIGGVLENGSAQTDKLVGGASLSYGGLSNGLVGSIGLGGFTNGIIGSLGELDEYSLSVVAGNTYSVAMFANGSGIGPGSNLNTYLRVYSDAGLTNQIAFNDNGGDGSNSYLEFTAASSGTFYVQSGAFNNVSTGTYSLIVEDETIDRPRDALDWGSSFYDNAINIYFAEAGQVYDGKSSLGWTSQQIADTMDALTQMVGDITLTATRTFTAASANMVLLTYNANDSSSGYFNPPGFGDSAGIGAWNLQPNSYLSGGRYANAWGPGNGAYHTLLHEFGHALGLSHAHDSGGTSDVMDGVTSNQGDYGDYGLNQGAYTIMGYNYQGDINGDAAGGTSGSANYGFALGPSALDLGILQSRYGADMTVNTGN